MIILTGGTGFLGGALLDALVSKNVICLGRTKPSKISAASFYQSEFKSDADFSDSVRDVSALIHCAARVHAMNDTSSEPLEEFRAVNTYGTLNLAEQAAEAGVKRFVFISSIKVSGESTKLGFPFKSSDDYLPSDPYGLSKYEAEVGLQRIAEKTGMEVVIIRPPLVYGPGVKANFAAMMKLADKNLPLPLGAINNKRSLVAIDNLVDLIVTCIDHPAAANQTFLVSDDHDVSTTELLETMTRAAGKRPWLLPVPMSVLSVSSKLIGKQAIFERLCGNLQVDITHTKQTLGWKPVVSFEEGINRCFV